MMLLSSVKRIDGDNLSICQEDLEWLLHIAKDVLISDIEYFKDSPMAKIVEYNLARVYDTIALTEGQ